MPNNDPSVTSVRVFCNNDACEFKDMRIEGVKTPKCPECGASMSTTQTNRRPQRDTHTY